MDALSGLRTQYAECSTYADTGVVEITFIHPGDKRITKRPFLTAFLRPDRFRFEFHDEIVDGQVTRLIIWRSGRRVRVHWDIEPIATLRRWIPNALASILQRTTTIAMAVAGATGVSGGSAHTVPQLLMPREISGTSLAQPDSVDNLPSQLIDGRQCSQLRLRFRSSIETVWIDSETYLLRQTAAQHVFSDFETQTITRYRPAMNQPVSEDALKFAL